MIRWLTMLGLCCLAVAALAAPPSWVYTLTLAKGAPDGRDAAVRVVTTVGTVSRAEVAGAAAEAAGMVADATRLRGDLKIGQDVWTLDATVDGEKLTGTYRATVGGKALNGALTGTWQARSDWPSYRGGNGAFSESSGVKLISDMTRAKLLWESEERGIGFGKSDSGYGRSLANFGDLDPAGIASPIVAGGLVIVSYAVPSGDVIDQSYKAALTPENWEKYKHKVRVAADDVVIAIDAETGKTRWKRVFAGAGRNPGSGKRNLYGMTPLAADGRVFAVGTCGALYALDLATGETLWQLPSWPALEAARDAALKAGGPAQGESPTGWLMMVDGVLIVPMSTAISPLRGGTARGVDPASGKTLWDANINPNLLAPGVVNGKACLLSPRICLEAKTGKVLWKSAYRPGNFSSPPVFGKELLIGFEVHPQSVAELKAGGAASLGVLAGYAVDEQGATLKWTLPPQYRRWMKPDDGGFICLATRDGLIYHVCNYQERDGAPVERRAVIVREADGAILASRAFPSNSDWHPYLWGDRFIAVSDLSHRPRGVNPEIWQMYAADPADFSPLGLGWHVNGNPPVHVGTCGYELQLLEAFADGIAYFRVAGGIRAYDLRARPDSTRTAFQLLGPVPGLAKAANYASAEAETEAGRVTRVQLLLPRRSFENVERVALTGMLATPAPVVAGRWSGELDLAPLGLEGERWHFDLDLTGATPAGTYRHTIAALPRPTAVAGAADAKEETRPDGVKRLVINLKQAAALSADDPAEKRRDLYIVVDRPADGDAESWARARLLNTATYDVQRDALTMNATQVTCKATVLLHPDLYVNPSTQRSGSVALTVDIALQRQGDAWVGTYTGQYGVAWTSTGAIAMP